MADLTITASQVLPGADADIDYLHRAGEALAQGQNVYLASDGTYKKTDANIADPVCNIDGITLNAASTGQPIAVQRNGQITLGAGAAMTIGDTYGNSDTAGEIAPMSDKTTGDIVSIGGVAITAAILQMARLNTGIAHA